MIGAVGPGDGKRKRLLRQHRGRGMQMKIMPAFADDDMERDQIEKAAPIVNVVGIFQFCRFLFGKTQERGHNLVA